jgi:hypothetical protein
MAREAARFVADAFHQIAVAGDHVGLVIDQAVAKARGQMRSASAMPTALAMP